MMKFAMALGAAAVGLSWASMAQARSVIMISVDGMNPEYVTEAEQRAIKVPVMQKMMGQGSYATGVTGITPSVSWPSAATLMTGVEPARHGVLSNHRFVPGNRNAAGSVYFYASDIKVDTLWDATARAGKTTANMDQLGSVGNPNVHFDIPRYEPYSNWPDNRRAIGATARPGGLLDKMEQKLGAYNGVDFDTPDYDRSRVRFAIEMLQQHKPDFMSIHLSGVDVNAHAHGPYSPQAIAAAEEIDGLIGDVHAAALKIDPDAIVVVVSDHGQAAVNEQLQIRIPFVEAGLLTVSPASLGQPARVTDWQADMWDNAVMLKSPNDASVKTKVRQLLEKLAVNPANGILRILDEAEISKTGGYPGASFLLDMKPGIVLGGRLAGDLRTKTAQTIGVHGYMPSHPAMNSAFFMVGKGVKANHNLGHIDMREIAPTIGKALGVTLRDSRHAPLPAFTK